MIFLVVLGLTTLYPFWDAFVVSFSSHKACLSQSIHLRSAEWSAEGYANIFRGEKLPERPLFWHYPRYGNQGGNPAHQFLRGEWKLIERFEDGHCELYHVTRDVGELQDEAVVYPEKVSALQKELHDWQHAFGVKFPVRNTEWYE